MRGLLADGRPTAFVHTRSRFVAGRAFSDDQIIAGGEPRSSARQWRPASGRRRRRSRPSAALHIDVTMYFRGVRRREIHHWCSAEASPMQRCLTIWFLEARLIVRVREDNSYANGLPFRSAGDPRVPWVAAGRRVQWRSSPHLVQPAQVSRAPAPPITIASGTESTLVSRRGVALQASNVRRVSLAAVTLAARRDGGSPLGTGPRTPSSRVDLLFRERAFWLFATGERLGDLRRLVNQYGRAREHRVPDGPVPRLVVRHRCEPAGAERSTRPGLCGVHEPGDCDCRPIAEDTRVLPESAARARLSYAQSGRRISEAAQFAKLFPLHALARSRDALQFPRDRRVISA